MTDGTMTAAAWRDMQVKAMTEAQLQAVIIASATRNGWLAYHTHDSRRSQPGFPDLVLVHPARKRIVYRELKTMKGKLTDKQQEWLEALQAAHVDAGVWRPVDWYSGAIATLIHGDVGER